MCLTRVDCHVHKSKEEKAFAQSRKFEELQSTKQSQLEVLSLAEFESAFHVFIVLLISSTMSEILVVSVHSGWNERRIEDALSPKTI